MNTPTETYLFTRYLQSTLAVFAGLLFLSFTTKELEQKIEYKVIFHGDSVGNMLVYKNKTGDNVSLKMVSNVQTRFIVKVKVKAEEVSSFKNGKLIYSNVSRIVNGKEKAAKQTKATGNTYQATSFGKPVAVENKPIDYNMSMLYCEEPLNKQTVYSDNFQKFLDIEKISLHKYKIVMPDGNYNYYTFQNGICQTAELHHSFYTIYIQLRV